MELTLSHTSLLRLRHYYMEFTMLFRFFLFPLTLLFFTACGGGGSSSSTDDGSKYSLEYKGLTFFSKDMSKESYKLSALSDDEFNQLTEVQKLQVADKLLSSLFFGYEYKQLQEKIDSGSFLSDTYNALSKESTQREWLESYITDPTYFVQGRTNSESTTILTRFYAAKELDSYFFNNYIAFILTQTIMFSPAYELESSHYPNVATTYNNIVRLLEDEATFSNITYTHMMSEENWRRFRSPEDNGREMLEIFASDTDDAHVPLAAKALQNWKLDRDNDTLVVTLNENTQAIKLFGSTIYNGDDFYRELVKSDDFKRTIIRRLVEFFFGESSERDSITNTIFKSNPKTWQDILKQILFSKEYLLNNSRAKSAEEIFFSLTKKINFKHRDNTLEYFKYRLTDMHQAVMKYKLGKLQRVPLDTLSFITAYKYFREEVVLRYSDEKYADEYSKWQAQGWRDSFVANENFEYMPEDVKGSLESLIEYIFHFILLRDATKEELAMFEKRMLTTKDSQTVLSFEFDMFTQKDTQERNKRNIVMSVLDYITRVDSFYLYKEVK